MEPDQIIHAYEEMFMTQGWKNFVQNIRENKEALYQMLMQKDTTERDLQWIKGRDEVYGFVVNFEEQIKVIKEQMEANEAPV